MIIHVVVVVVCKYEEETYSKNEKNKRNLLII